MHRRVKILLLCCVLQMICSNTVFFKSLKWLATVLCAIYFLHEEMSEDSEEWVVFRGALLNKQNRPSELTQYNFKVGGLKAPVEDSIFSSVFCNRREYSEDWVSGIEPVQVEWTLLLSRPYPSFGLNVTNGCIYISRGYNECYATVTRGFAFTLYIILDG